MSSKLPEKLKSKRPANTAFKQQRLKAWQPILTPKTVLPAFFAIGAVFIPMGVGLYLASEKVVQTLFDYTNCQNNDNSFQSPITKWTYDAATRKCTINFNIDSDMTGPVYLYYRLTNFYQNHRRYVKSFDSSQLANKLGTNSPGGNCNPLSHASDVANYASVYKWLDPNNSSQQNAQIYPCGLIANSYFTDEISDLTSGTNTIVFSEGGIAWPSDSGKFVKSNLPDTLGDSINKLVVPPPQWVKAFPDFDVSSYGGTKSIVISTVSILGGKNSFLGIAYMTVGAFCWFLGILFLLRQMFKPRKLGDYTYLSWTQPQRGSSLVEGAPGSSRA
ncbi:hypothetical protein HDU76_012336 [Blyttiomyces sp. JEL0837]|nr:hypothetical protein HDU76_012336 [Blyttiomyces sp. JEL0837]